MAPVDSGAAARERDRGLQRLRRWTVGCVAAAAGLVGLVAVLAAGTFPGRAITGAASSVGASDQPAQPSDSSGFQSGDDQPAAPPSGFFGGGGGSPSVASGGS